MKILFCGFQHSHILGLYDMAKARQDVEIVACIEDDELKKTELSKNGIVFDENTYDHWLEMDFDTVAVGCEYGRRGEIIIKALKAGKHVITDKPVCTSREELEEITALVNEKGLKLACMLDLRYRKTSIIAKSIIESGRLGEVCNVSFTGQHHLAYGTRPSWYFKKGMHGGTINDIAIHGIDLVRHMTGLGVKKVNAARCWNSYAEKEPDFKDSAIFMAELDNSAGLLADVSYAAPSQGTPMPTYWDFKIWCAKGLIHFSAYKDGVFVYENGKDQPDIVDEDVAAGDYLTDFIHEIENNETVFTQSVIYSTDQTLMIQEFSNK